MSLSDQADWKPEAAAAGVVRAAVECVIAALPEARQLAQRLLTEAGVRLADLVDTIHLAEASPLLTEALAAGWVRAENNIQRNEQGVFPQIALDPALAADEVALDLKVESVAHFRFVHQLSTEIEGAVDSCWRRAVVATKRRRATLAVVERHGWRGVGGGSPAVDLALRQGAYEAFLTRRRDFDDNAHAFDEADVLVDVAIASVGRDVACELFFAAERAYWMRRNRAGTLQYQRQQALGIGWANHDHHTYRSSRVHFRPLVALWEKLGLVCRERFYAGREAGWGAQVMEQPVTGIVTFNDVDLSPEELFGDFSHNGLAPRDRLGTIGLWCGLHGESLAQAGMHHLEAMFSFDDLRDQLQQNGVGVMKPFTDFAYLRQAFTEGERWTVAEARIVRLLNQKLITAAQAEQFRANGALGSHLENLERNDGFKGFNQTGVSQIIAATDPRAQAAV